jgi:hypothetical protein
MRLIKKRLLIVKILLVLILYIFLNQRSEYHLILVLLAALSIKANPNTGYLFISNSLINIGFSKSLARSE